MCNSNEFGNDKYSWVDIQPGTKVLTINYDNTNQALEYKILEFTIDKRCVKVQSSFDNSIIWLVCDKHTILNIL